MKNVENVNRFFSSSPPPSFFFRNSRRSQTNGKVNFSCKVKPKSVESQIKSKENKNGRLENHQRNLKINIKLWVIVVRKHAGANLKAGNNTFESAYTVFIYRGLDFVQRVLWFREYLSKIFKDV